MGTRLPDYNPTLVAAPADLPVSVAEVKSGPLIVEHADRDAYIETLIRAAVARLDGPFGELGACLYEQSWRDDFDAFDTVLELSTSPAMSVTSVVYLDEAGDAQTVDAANYTLDPRHDGRFVVRFKDDWSPPTDTYEARAVRITYKAGHPAASIPNDIKTAIGLMVQALYDPPMPGAVNYYEKAAMALLSHRRRIIV